MTYCVIFTLILFKHGKREFWPRGYNFVFMLISVEHEILNAHKYKKFGFLLGSDKLRMLFFPLINVKMPTIVVGILKFMIRKNFMLS